MKEEGFKRRKVLLLTITGSPQRFLKEPHHALSSLSTISLHCAKLLRQEVVKGLGASEQLCQVPPPLGWKFKDPTLLIVLCQPFSLS